MKHFLYVLCSAAVLVSCSVIHRAAAPEAGEMNVGYGAASRDGNAMTVSEVRMTDAEELVFNDIFAYLRNKVPGVEVGNTSGADERPHIQIRGNRSITGNDGEPLFVVDGVEFTQIENIRPDEIYSVQVLKDSAASSYGSRGANGVIVFTTKVAHETAVRERAERKAARQQRRGK